MSNSKRIVWIVDIEGWAFDNKAKQITNNIEAEHLILAVAGKSKLEITKILDKFNPDILIFLSYFHFKKVCKAYKKKTKKIIVTDSRRLIRQMKNERY